MLFDMEWDINKNPTIVGYGRDKKSVWRVG